MGIATAFHTVFLEGVPQLTRNDINRVGAILSIGTLIYMYSHLYLYIIKKNPGHRHRLPHGVFGGRATAYTQRYQQGARYLTGYIYIYTHLYLYIIK